MISRRTITRIAALLLVAVIGSAMPAGAQDGDPLPTNPYERLAEIRRRQAEAAMAIDILNATQVEVQKRLATVEAWVASQEQVVAQAQAELVDATLVANRARQREQAKAAELQSLKDLMAQLAVEAYMRPPQMAAMNVIVTHDLASAEKADVMLRAKAERDENVAEDLAAAEKALSGLREAADAKASRAETAAEDAAGALDDLQSARNEQLALAQQVHGQLEQTSAQLVTLSSDEVAAAEDVQRQTAALLARVDHGTDIPLVTVRGIQVHADIAPALEGLLSEAEAAGIELSGWGYRTTESQISLRRQHCGGPGVDDATAVYVVAPGACSPPTAKPGTSMHELGLAVDLTVNGEAIHSHDDPAWIWLNEHAGEYGFQNLPSEPWHWSINGK